MFVVLVQALSLCFAHMDGFTSAAAVLQLQKTEEVSLTIALKHRRRAHGQPLQFAVHVQLVYTAGTWNWLEVQPAAHHEQVQLVAQHTHVVLCTGSKKKNLLRVISVGPFGSLLRSAFAQNKAEKVFVSLIHKET